MILLRKCIYVCFMVLVLMLSGCNGKENRKIWTLEDCEAVEISCLEGEAPYAEVWECVLPYGRTVVGSYCLHDFKVYYEVNYWNTLIDQTGMTPNNEFSEEYNTQIRCYDMVNQTDELVYRYDSSKCEDVINIECNGRYLIWEKIDNDGWELNSISLQGKGRNPDVVTELSEGEMQTVFFTLRDDSVIWYDYVNGKLNLYSYKLDTGEVSLLCEDCTLASPYEPPYIVGDDIVLYRTNEEEITDIISLDRKNRQKLQVQIQSKMVYIEANNDFYVWRNGYEDKILYFYDNKQKRYSKIECGHIFSYALQDRYLVLNLWSQDSWNGEGIYCIDLKENQAYYVSGTDVTTLWTNSGPNNVYWQEVDDTSDFIIKNMVFH